jgi:diadenosine tetraphosphate (Ap4A) HIT family hydrolase
MSCCNIREVFDEDNLLIKEYKYWNLLLRKNTKTLGNCVAITREHHESLVDLNREEMAEFLDVVKDFNKALKTAFNHDKTNYLMLMMKDKHTHFHIFPRYVESRSFAGIEWVDGMVPADPLELKGAQELSTEVLQTIKKEIIKNI